MELIIEKLNKLPTLENSLPMLLEIKMNLIALPDKNVITSLTKFSIPAFKPLFDLLNSSDRDQVKTCIEILNLILSNIEAKHAIMNLHEQFLRGFDHPDENVRLLILKQLLLYCEDYKSITQLLRDRSLLHMILRSLGDESLEVVKYAHKVILALSCQTKVNNSIETMFNCGGAPVLRNVMKISDSSRFHVYDIIVKISVLDEKNLLYMASLGFINCLIGEILAGDVLTQLNALELLSELALNIHGLRFLQASGIITKLSYLLSTSRKGAITAILLPGLLKFFGHLGSVHPHILAEDEAAVLSEIMKTVIDYESGAEFSLQLIAFETLTHVGIFVDGKIALLKYPVEMKNVLKVISSNFKNLPTEVQTRVLDALAELFFLKIEDHSDDLDRCIKMWFEHLSDESSMKFIFNIAKLPLPELLCSCFRVMKSLANFQWGIRVMAEESGLIEFLLDRRSSHTKSNKELQWELLGLISRNKFANEFFTEEVNSKFSKFFEQGAFFVEAEYSVAFED